MQGKDHAPGLKDVAIAANVSLTTAGNVLRSGAEGQRKHFSEETALRVREAARQLGYNPNRAARAMRTRESGVIGFVSVNYSQKWGTVENYTSFPFLVGLSHALVPSGRHVALVEIDELELDRERRLPNALNECFFDALIVHFGLSPIAQHLLGEFKIPRIYWDSGIFKKSDCIYRNEKRISSLLTERLIGQGHRRIVFSAGLGLKRYLSKKATHFSFGDRHQGYQEAMEAAGLRAGVLTGYHPEELARQIASQKATAAVIQGNTDYGVILQALMILGLRASEDFAVLACDVETGTINRSGRLCGATYNRYQVGKVAAEMVMKKLESNEERVPSYEIPIKFSFDHPPLSLPSGIGDGDLER